MFKPREIILYTDVFETVIKTGTVRSVTARGKTILLEADDSLETFVPSRYAYKNTPANRNYLDRLTAMNARHLAEKLPLIREGREIRNVS